MKLKVCGMRRPENIEDLLTVKPDFIGFIFYPKSSRYAPRFLDPMFAKMLDGPQKVGVFVNEDVEDVKYLARDYGLDMLQLHGQESPELCGELRDAGYQVIKVFSVGSEFDFDQLTPYEDVVDYFLFDTKGLLPGGNGTTFDWSLLEDYAGKVPFFLSGGIGPDHVAQIQALDLPMLYALDVNSKFEVKPGLKDVGKVGAFWEQLM
ncbi:MAG: phosphoribosylanthranilate isomerase [Bacteroidota bacterium]